MANQIPLQLSNVHPDFESVLAQLQIFLRQKGTWADTVESSGGEILLEATTALATFNQAGIELAFRETFLETARRKSSIYAITRMLGVRIGRKTPAGVNVLLSRPQSGSSITVDAYSQFKVGNTLFFNRDPIVFPNDVFQVNTRLYQGEVRNYSIPSTSTEFREIYLPEQNFSIADSDIKFSVTEQTGQRNYWDLSFDGIWAAGPDEKVFYDTTGPSGQCLLTLGDGIHGSLPPIGATLNIIYVITTGRSANNGTVGLDVVSIDTDIKYTGFSTSSIAGGGDEQSSEFYRRTAPFIYRARKRAVTKADYLAIIRGYSTVADALVLNQKDIAPNDVRWMNVVRICILPQDTDTYSTAEWNDFLAYFDDYKQYLIQIIIRNPVNIKVDVSMNVYAHYNQNLSVIKQAVSEAITNVFAKGIGTIGRKIAVSDIIRAASLPSQVDYVDIVTPTQDQVPASIYNWFSLRNLNISVFYTERRNA